jgi:hypothetical protein
MTRRCGRGTLVGLSSLPRVEPVVSRTLRRLILVLVLAATAVGVNAGAPSTADAASCVRISGGNFNAPGDDNLAANLNGEYVRIKNYCSTGKYLTGWKLHDYGRKHTYYFRSGFRIGAYVSVTLYSGRGTNSSTRLYWGRSYGAVWNNTPPERAYLRNGAGTLMWSWSAY